MRSHRSHRISGVVEEEDSGRPLPNLIIRAYDEDLLFHDLLGFATTDAAGRFEIRFGERQFQGPFEGRPDIFLRIFESSGRHEIHDTRAEIRRGAGTDEQFQVVVPATNLAPPFRRRDPSPQRGQSFDRALRELSPRAPVTPGLVGLNVLVFFAMSASGTQLFEPDAEELLAWGANFGPATLGGAWWRAATCLFLHAGAIHLAGNMILLWSAGRVLERLVGSASFAVLYLVSGLLGSLASLAWNPLGVGVGASGAVLGTFGGLIGFAAIQRESAYLSGLKGMLAAALLFALCNALPGQEIDNAAHIGGLLGGLACGLILSQPLSYRSLPRRRWRLLAVSGFGLVAVLASAASVPARVVDLLAAQERFAERTQQIIERYEALLERARRGELSARALARSVEEDVLPEWRAARETLEQAGNVPKPVRAWRAGAVSRSWAIEQELLSISESLGRYESELENFYAVENEVVAAYNLAVDGFRHQLYPVSEMRVVVEEEVLPRWQALRARLEGVRGLSGGLHAEIDTLAAHVRERERAWEQMAQALRDGDPARIEQAFAALARRDDGADAGEGSGEASPP